MEPALEANLARLLVAILQRAGYRWESTLAKERWVEVEFEPLAQVGRRTRTDPIGGLTVRGGHTLQQGMPALSVISDYWVGALTPQ